MPPSVTLTAESTPLPAGPFVFADAGTVAVGRDAGCRLHLPDDRPQQRVSRQHCQLALDPPCATVRDTNSTHGTFVNGVRIDGNPRPLFDGDVLRLADYSFRVTTDPLVCCNCLQHLAGDHQRTAVGRPFCLTGLSCQAPLTCPPGPYSEAARQLLSHVPSLPEFVNEGQLGEGGMGAVYRLRHSPTGRFVALKVMLPAYADDPRLLARFQDEIANTRALAHDNVVAVLDSGRDGNTYYYVMEYCDGGNLESLVARRGPLPVADAVALVRPVLDVLDRAAVTRGGIIHRDLKPMNLLLSGSVVKVADFGLARAFDDRRLTSSGSRMGTPSYCHKAQMINAKAVGAEVDVWATAACLFFLLTGQAPRKTTPGESIIEGLLRPVRPVGPLRPDLPPALAEVIDGALSEDAFTYPTAAAFRAALDAAV